ncbi:glycosyltransferase family 4 protein [Gramella sp. AN32]|uniref:Glycosyltransferase family 4 protein n=1 Tax=Christiangramia antarctica TaxID=2058158 RepID=A0ABW5X6N7_9FLAO|nr:glycosyltransferase family 4 protein [Gramella sp. AN32]MCM4154681.1 glycosyl transferase [Gramella sp. AN32]
MKFGIFTHAGHFCEEDKLFAYGPYVKEMNLWIDYFDKVLVLAPLASELPKNIDAPYKHENIVLKELPIIHFEEDGFLISLKKSFKILLSCITEMRSCDHLHIRCPGNIGLIALIASIFFPKKPKTIKYAGNWDPNSKQPWSYRFQKWLLNNPFLIQNKKVLIYGKWKKQPEYILSFFTATFSELDKTAIDKKIDNNLTFIYCGGLVSGKNPFLVVKIIHKLILKACPVHLLLYGDGSLHSEINDYVQKHGLSENIKLMGNRPQSVLKEAYEKAHFCILPSKSEGWPKAIAEGMFYGCVPIATKVSCIPWMLDFGNRGILIEEDLESAVDEILRIINHPVIYQEMSQNSVKWSRTYTLEKFEKAIQKIL